MPKKQPGFYMYPNDWFGDVELQLGTSTTTKGVWAQMLMRMDRAKDRGVLSGNISDLAQFLNVKEDELRDALVQFELQDVGEVVRGKDDSVRVVSRRMRREAKSKQSDKLRKRRKRASDECPEDVRSTSSEDPQREVEVEEGIEREEGGEGEGIFTKNKYFEVSVAQHKSYRDAYPDLNVEGEYKRMVLYLDSHPEKAYKNWAAFVNNWLSRTYQRMQEGEQAAPEKLERKKPSDMTCGKCGKVGTAKIDGLCTKCYQERWG